MLCATVQAPSFIEAKKQIIQMSGIADCIELRIDLCGSLSLTEIAQLLNLSSCTILTLRKSASMSEKDWVHKIFLLAKLHPQYLDIDQSFPKRALQQLRSLYPDIRIILSCHSQNPEDLYQIYSHLAHYSASIDHIKIAITPKSTSQVLDYIRKASYLPKNTTFIGMGEYGIPSRILSPIMGNGIHYAAAAKPTAAGQLPIQDLLHYNYKQLSSCSKIYALIGDDVSRSISHLSHNFLFTEARIDATYLKLPVKDAQELRHSLQKLKTLPVAGLSITSPFKQTILPFLDEQDLSVQESHACNTILIKGNRLLGYNTDGIGCFRALQNRGIAIHNQRIAILGAGGAARAIAHTLARQGAYLSIFNRTIDQAQDIASRTRGRAFLLTEISHQPTYDIIINALPPHVHLPNISAPIMMDINVLTPTLTPGKKTHLMISGIDMFIEQALYQFNIWFPQLMTEEITHRFRRKTKEFVTEILRKKID